MKLPDKRNKNILININGELLPRNEAKVSVFDSSCLLYTSDAADE